MDIVNRTNKVLDFKMIKISEVIIVERYVLYD